MGRNRTELGTLKRLFTQTDLILSRATFPESARCRELLGAAVILTDDLLKQDKLPAGQKPPMRVCFTLKVRAERIEEYKQRHTQVWPEMLDALRETGWHNYSLFLRPDGLLVGYLETPDFERACAAMKDHPVNARWQAEMSPFFESFAEGSADDNMFPLDEVFHLD